MSCKNCNGVLLVNIFFKIFLQFFKIRVECPFKGLTCPPMLDSNDSNKLLMIELEIDHM